MQQVVTTPAAVLDRQVPIQITLPPQTGIPDAPQRILTIQVPASAIQGRDFIIHYNCFVILLRVNVQKRLHISDFFYFEMCHKR